jgi:ABC-type phosphate transport system ATPase subunit
LQDELIKLSEYNNELKLLDATNEKMKKLEESARLEIDSLKKFREIIINNDLISKDIKNLRDINNEKNREIKEINGKILLDKNNYNNNLILIEKIRENNKIATKLNEEIEIYEILNKLTSKDGVQLYLLSQSLDDITNKINNILEPFINKTVQIKLEGEKIELNVMSKDDNVIHSLSGMEGFLLDLSIRVIINNLSCMPKSNILFMDESISVLDKHRLASIEELFVFLRQYYKSVFLITHMKQVNNHINHSLEIIKYNDNSLIYNIDIKSKNNVLKLDDIEYILENNMNTNIDNNSIVVISDKNNKKLKSKSKVLNKSLDKVIQNV